jgi:hypothetical protein
MYSLGVIASFVHIVSYVVFEGDPCTFLITIQGMPFNCVYDNIYVVDRNLETPDTTINGINRN